MLVVRCTRLLPSLCGTRLRATFESFESRKKKAEAEANATNIQAAEQEDLGRITQTRKRPRPRLQLVDSDLREVFAKGSGPGGQKINKVETFCGVL